MPKKESDVGAMIFHLFLILRILWIVFVRVVFKTACSIKIDEYVATVSPEIALENRAATLPKNNVLIEDIDYYLENGNRVFKEWYHLKRGHCCKNEECKHCPY